jgi:alkanesulfonate monooxygenase SsuD/methylene tetrahydromethanopterin reductase-like flavin-dependent oxidoreductase (luciferase family)
MLPNIPWRISAGGVGTTNGGQLAATGGTTGRLRALASAAEELGAEGIWASDHLFWHRPVLEPLVSLAVVATASTTATLGTCILQLPMRTPEAVARQTATLQLFSDGRFVLGLGVGSHPGEYEAAGADFARRGRRLDEGIADLRRAWSTSGDAGVRYRQDPPVPPVPLWIAGSSDAALRRAALLGDGWVPLFVPPGPYAAARTRLLDQVAACGRDPGSFASAVVVTVCTGPSTEVAREEGTRWLSDLYDLPPKAFERHLIAGTPEDCAGAVHAYHDAGAGHVVVMVAADETLDHFGPLIEALTPRPAPTLLAEPARLGAAP